MRRRNILAHARVLIVLSVFSIICKASAQKPAENCLAATKSADKVEEMKFNWPHLWRYCNDDLRLGSPAAGENRVVFLGDSITEAWNLAEAFPGKPYINRGVSGETTSQMLLRFRQDVIDLHPAIVVILAGTNDIAGNTGPITVKAIEDNLASMVEIAQANRVRVVLASVLPALDYPWRHGQEPVEKIAALNSWLKSFAVAHGEVYLDFYSTMQDDKHGLSLTLSSEGVHPNKAGYAVMAHLAERSIAQVLR